jgi:septal ring factor EnvC (AmiA/AmiB activator)
MTDKLTRTQEQVDALRRTLRDLEDEAAAVRAALARAEATLEALQSATFATFDTPTAKQPPDAFTAAVNALPCMQGGIRDA